MEIFLGFGNNVSTNDDHVAVCRYWSHTPSWFATSTFSFSDFNIGFVSLTFSPSQIVNSLHPFIGFQRLSPKYKWVFLFLYFCMRHTCFLLLACPTFPFWHDVSKMVIIMFTITFIYPLNLLPLFATLDGLLLGSTMVGMGQNGKKVMQTQSRPDKFFITLLGETRASTSRMHGG